MTYQIFVSYAREDNVKREISKLCEDLSRLIGERLNVRGADVAFFDTKNIEIGKDWSATIVDGLCTSRAFVTLVSPNSVASEYCGREFEAFRRRAQAANRAAELMFPVMWLPPTRKLPDALAALQNHNETLPEDYRLEGLSLIQRLNGFHDVYIKTLTVLAKRIVDAIESAPLADAPPGSIAPLTVVPNAFAPPAGAVSGGPNTVQFVYVAAQPGQIQPYRPDSTAYGPEGGWHWCPYLPPEENKTTVGQIAIQVAGRHGIEPVKIEVNENVSQSIQAAIRKNNMVAVFVDPWTLRLDEYQRWMQAVDTSGQPPHCTIVVATNPTDPEQARTDHESFILAAFPGHVTGANDTYFNTKLTTPGALETWLDVKLPALRTLIANASEAKRLVDNSKRLDTISGPGGDPNKGAPGSPPPRPPAP